MPKPRRKQMTSEKKKEIEKDIVRDPSRSNGEIAEIYNTNIESVRKIRIQIDYAITY